MAAWRKYAPIPMLVGFMAIVAGGASNTHDLRWLAGITGRPGCMGEAVGSAANILLPRRVGVFVYAIREYSTNAGALRLNASSRSINEDARLPSSS